MRSRLVLVIVGALTALAAAVSATVLTVAFWLPVAMPEPPPKPVPVRNNDDLETAKRLAMPHLKGIVRLSDDGSANIVQGKMVLSCKGMDKDGKLHDIGVTWLVATFDGKQRWQLESVMIGDNILYSGDGPISNP
jgi:hypothetical protein